MPELPNRHSIRLQGYDYSSTGMYFVTIVTQGHRHLLGEIVGETMQNNRVGEMVGQQLTHIHDLYENVFVKESVLMPNHMHYILFFDGYINERHAQTLSDIIRNFKSYTNHLYGQQIGNPSAKLWQRNYYEHIIRNERAYQLIRSYIIDNPRRWKHDKMNSSCSQPDEIMRDILRVS